MNNVLFGINFGSKLSGNTVISLVKQNKIYFIDVDEDVDADMFIYNAAKHFRPDVVFLNAPLSLPGAYTNTCSYSDYEYREADKQICSISPMIAGGITARAMALKDKLESDFDSKVYETCSKAQAQNYDLLKKGYMTNQLNLFTCRNHISDQLSPKMMFRCQDIKTWGHLDAMLSLITAMRFVTGQALPYGNNEEGLIYV